MIIGLQFSRADEVVGLVHPDDMVSESKVRNIIQSQSPDAETIFYYFNGHQIFGIFRDLLDPHRFLAVIFPDGSVDMASIKMDDREVIWDVNPLNINVGVIDADTGDISNIDGVLTTIGGWFQLADEDFDLEIDISHNNHTWRLSALRRKGEWSGSLEEVPKTK